MSTQAETLKVRQAAAKRAEDRMLAALLDYSPCADLRVNDVKFIAGYARTLAFDAIEQVLEGQVAA